MFALTACVIVALVFVIHFYIVTPLLVRGKMSFSANPSFEEVSADDPRLPAQVRTFFGVVVRELESLGFPPAAYLINPDFIPGTTGYLAICINHAKQDSAAAMACFARVSPAPEKQTYNVDFSTMFTDDSSIITSNTDSPPNPPKLPSTTAWRFPHMADLGQLYRIHQEMVIRGDSPASKHVPAPDAFAEHMRSAVIQECQERARAGYLFLDSGKERFRCTIRGAFLTCWSLLWPVSRIRRRLLVREARRILKSLNLPSHYPKVDYRKLVHQQAGA